jgi:hypothetical protein
MGEEKSINTKDWIDIAFKVLALLVIPMFAWGLKIHTDNAVLKHKVESLRNQVLQAEAVKKSVDDNKGNLIEVKTKLLTLNGTLNDVKKLLERQNERWQRFLIRGSFGPSRRGNRGGRRPGR